jgi:hypothetical protein
VAQKRVVLPFFWLSDSLHRDCDSHVAIVRGTWVTLATLASQDQSLLSIILHQDIAFDSTVWIFRVCQVRRSVGASVRHIARAYRFLPVMYGKGERVPVDRS